ncbi:MAG: hypothetical protein K9L88_08000 [Chromatiaceae bacterium]|nr:hypothetical protein [Chromatiaceae bacterium]
MSQQLWDARFLDMAAEIASWSKDPSTSVGCVIVDPQRRIVSSGYNGFPGGVDDDPALMNDRDIKLRITLHAEHNAILFAQRDLSGCTLYVYPMPPCAHCAAQIAQVGITRVVSGLPDDDQIERWGRDWALAEWVFEQRGVAVDYADEAR